ncbi:hypothetical protein F4824DRAFT_110794 [Ustulina deusta]|nr:hypothetical protein F4824DRAFT_110794 [Ustulina deusta]
MTRNRAIHIENLLRLPAFQTSQRLSRASSWIQVGNTKQDYCPRDLTTQIYLQDRPMHKWGYVFCHRGLYERASGFIDNSDSALNNGIREGFFLHEVDAFMGEKINDGFLAHDKTAGRVTSKKNLWVSYSLGEILETNLVARGVKLENPDIGSSYLETPDQVPDLESTLWKEGVAGLFKST